MTMIWHVSSTKGATLGIRIVKGRNNAIDAACSLIGGGYDVSQLVTSDSSGSIKAQEIRGIYERRRTGRST